MFARRWALTALIFAAHWPVSGRAHDIYMGLRDGARRRCCNDADCRPAPYRITPTGVQMFADGRWYAVPERTIQHRALPGDTGETGGAHWCGGLDPDGWIRTHCAILPPNSAALRSR